VGYIFSGYDITAVKKRPAPKERDYVLQKQQEAASDMTATTLSLYINLCTRLIGHYNYNVVLFIDCYAPCGLPGQPLPPYTFSSPLPHLLLYPLVSFTFPFLTCFIYFLAFPSLPSPHSTRILPLRFHAGCCRRRLNVALVCLVNSMFYVCLVKDACLFVLHLI